MSTATPLAGLPKITRYVGMMRGESMQETCPHCGARGTVIHHFECEDGTTRGAMSGCVQMFPWSIIAREHKRICEKQADYAKRGWDLPRFDQRSLAVIEDHYAGGRDLASAERELQAIKREAAEWRQRRNRR